MNLNPKESYAGAQVIRVLQQMLADKVSFFLGDVNVFILQQIT
ncbi:hypothetical protein HanPI659440_Chr03g0128671 [Helianthus annuus]|nr:hypothetical protein HanPI659440_Chr03g0128671 [Helianthus annuus]